jgi:hypothetical protein
MDPNEALENLRYWSAEDATGQEWLERGAEVFAGLDEWITKGGFLPRAWAPPLMDMDNDSLRAARRLETAFDRALRDDEQLDIAFSRKDRAGGLRDRLIRLLAMTVVEEVQQERRNVERMLASTATRVFLRNLRTQLEQP